MRCCAALLPGQFYVHIKGASPVTFNHDQQSGALLFFSIMTTNEEDEVLAVISGFLATLSNNQRPLASLLNYVLPESFAVLTYPGGMLQCTLKDLVMRSEQEVSKIYASGASSTKCTLVEPGPEIWVCGRLAAVWSGVTLDVDGTVQFSGTGAFTLFKREDGWKIGGIAATKCEAGGSPPPSFEDALPSLVETVLESNRLLNEKRWDEIDRPLLPGGGCTYARFPHTLSAMLWPELNGKMRIMSEKAPGYVEHKLMNWEGRVIGDLGFVWTPFTVTLDGKLRISGYHNVYTLLKVDDKWLISGTHDG